LKPVPAAIVRHLKRTDGMTVRELARALGMSYMGVKKPCVDLVKQGFLKTSRKPINIGRPELNYRLTEKGHEVFSARSNDLALALLTAARELYGTAAPSKLIYLCFREKERHYAAKIRGDDPIQRARWFIREREKEGYISSIEVPEDGASFRIRETHSPLADTVDAYPEMLRMEADMIERLMDAHTRLEPSPSASKGRHPKTYLVTPRTPDSACNPLRKPVASDAHE